MNNMRRKLAIATWDGPRESNIYGRMVLDTRSTAGSRWRVR